MQPAKFVEFVLTCGSWQEAQAIADQLLQQRLVACVEFIPIKSRSWWKQQIKESDEVKLIMESIADKFAAVEAEIAKLHSYETFVLQAIPIAQLSDQASSWLTEQVHD